MCPSNCRRYQQGSGPARGCARRARDYLELSISRHNERRGWPSIWRRFSARFLDLLRPVDLRALLHLIPAKCGRFDNCRSICGRYCIAVRLYGGMAFGRPILCFGPAPAVYWRNGKNRDRRTGIWPVYFCCERYRYSTIALATVIFVASLPLATSTIIFCFVSLSVSSTGVLFQVL